MLNRFLLPAFALGLSLAAAPAAAEELSVTVKIADLDLTTKADRKALEARLAKAERQVCGVRPSLRDLRGSIDYRQCLKTARASYQDQVRVALETANGRAVAVVSSALRFPA